MAKVAIENRNVAASVEERTKAFKEMSNVYARYLGVQESLTEEDQKYIDSLIDSNKEMVKSADGAKQLETDVKSLVGRLGDLRQAFGQNFSIDIIGGLDEAQTKAMLEFAKKTKQPVEKLTSLSQF